MSEPSYYELSQPESFEDTPQNNQNKISETKAKISKIQAQLADVLWNEDSLDSTQKQYESKKKEYEAEIESLVTERSKLKKPTKEQLDRINGDIALFNSLKIQVTADESQIELRRQQREKKLGDIIKLKSELTKFKEMKKQASYHKDLYEQIQELDDPEVLLGKLTDPGGDSIVLPFVDDPSESTERFKLINDKKIEYFPRERLRNIIQTFEDNLETSNKRVHMLYGTIGAGKSHILLATACYLLRRRDRVIYFSNAYTAVDINNWKVKFMFLLYQESRREQPDIDFIEATEKALALIEKAPPIGEFLKGLKQMNGKYLRIFIDQMNTIMDLNKKTPVVNSENTITKLGFERFLNSSGAHMMLSSSANDDDMYSNRSSGSEFPRTYIPVLSGFTPVEYNKWFDRCVEKLEAAGDSKKDVIMRKNFIKSKEKIEFLTRAAPLYLRLYFNSLQLTYDETVDEMKCHDDVKTIKSNISEFYRQKLRNDDGTYRDYAIKCMTDMALEDDAKDFVMQRYVYILGKRKYVKRTEREGCISCGFVAEFIAEALRQNNLTIDWSFDNEYLWQLKSKKQLVAILEEKGMEKIFKVGLPSCGICHEKPTDVKEITQATQVKLVDQEGERVYYKILRQNFEGVDALYLTNTKIIGINFTMNAKHTDPYGLFVEVLENIPNLQANMDKSNLYFVWMVTSNCKGKLFVPRTHTVDGVTFKIKKEGFPKEVDQVHKKFVKEHRARMDHIIKVAADSTNNVVANPQSRPEVKINANTTTVVNPTIPKKPRVGSGRQVTPIKVKPDELGVQKRGADLPIGETKPKRKLGSDNYPMERELSSGPESKRLRNSEENSNPSTEMEPSAELVPRFIEPGGSGKRNSGEKKRKIGCEDGNSTTEVGSDASGKSPTWSEPDASGDSTTEVESDALEDNWNMFRKSSRIRKKPKLDET